MMMAILDSQGAKRQKRSSTSTTCVSKQGDSVLKIMLLKDYASCYVVY